MNLRTKLRLLTISNNNVEDIYSVGDSPRNFIRNLENLSDSDINKIISLYKSGTITDHELYLTAYGVSNKLISTQDVSDYINQYRDIIDKTKVIRNEIFGSKYIHSKEISDPETKFLLSIDNEGTIDVISSAGQCYCKNSFENEVLLFADLLKPLKLEIKEYETEEYYISKLRNNAQIYIHSFQDGLFFDKREDFLRMTTALKTFYKQGDLAAAALELAEEVYQYNSNLNDISKGLLLMPESLDILACRNLLGNENINEAFPTEDALGFFDREYDERYYRELSVFGIVVEERLVGMHDMSKTEIDYENTRYKKYCIDLSNEMIDIACDRYPEYLITKLNAEDKNKVMNLYNSLQVLEKNEIAYDTGLEI